WNLTNKLTLIGRLGWLKYDLANPPSFGKLVGPSVSASAGKLGPGFGNVYTSSFSGTYVARPSLVIDSYFAWTSVNFNAEPPRLDENLGLDYLALPGTNGPSRLYGGWPQFSITSYAALGSPCSGCDGRAVVGANRQCRYSAGASRIKGPHD